MALTELSADQLRRLRDTVSGDVIVPTELQRQIPGLAMWEGILAQRSAGTSPSPQDRDAWLASLSKRG